MKPVQRPPKGEREVVFYETIFNKDEERDEILQLRRLLPHYYGIVELSILNLTSVWISVLFCLSLFLLWSHDSPNIVLSQSIQNNNKI